MKAFTLHPGSVPVTTMAKDSGLLVNGTDFPEGLASDTIELPAAVILHMSQGKTDWLNGR